MDNQVTAVPACTFPVSIKGVVVQAGRVLLLHNERDEWELPDGKLELGEDPAACVAQEIAEETGWPVTTGPILDAWQYHIRRGIDVLIVTYGCHTTATTPPVVSHEHTQVGLFAKDDVAAFARQATRRGLTSPCSPLAPGAGL